MPIFVYLLGMLITVMIAGAIQASRGMTVEDLDGESIVTTMLATMFWPILLVFLIVVACFTGPFYLGNFLYTKYSSKEK